MNTFISYPDKDIKMARKVGEFCKQKGHEPFIARDSMHRLSAHEGWLKALFSEIKRAEIFILCLNNSSINACTQQAEWGNVAVSRKRIKRIIVHLGEWNSEYEVHFPFVRNFQCFRLDDINDLKLFEMSLDPETPEEERFQFMQRLSIEAGTQLHLRYGGRAIFGEPLTIELRKNPALSIDVEVQEHIVMQIRKKYPYDGIIAEEKPERNFNAKTESGFMWLIDPLDGTLNFLGGDDRFCCGIGLLKQGQPYLGTIYVPSLMELYSGGIGREAKCLCLADGSVKCVHTDNSVRKLSECRTLFHFNTVPKRLEVCFENDLPRQLALSVKRVWMWGCGLLSAISVACGGHHVFLQRVTYPYDIIPALPILNSAGAVWQTIPSQSSLIWNPERKHVGIIVSSSETILNQVLKKFPYLK